jgi:hypothetical protein
MTGFFVDLTTTGTVLGLDHTSTPEAVHAVFGGEHTPPVDDFGLVEFGWQDREVTYFGAQAHRLAWLAGEVEPVLVERYGEFPARLDVDELREAVAGQSFPLEEQPHTDEDRVAYLAPVSHMGVLADRDSRDVLKILGPTHRSPWRSFPGQAERFNSYARHLFAATEAERERWFDRRTEDDSDWWDCLAAAAACRTGGTAETAQRWRLLRLALHRAAAARGVYPPDQAAATEVGLLLAAGLEPGDAVRRWLDTATRPGDLPAARRLRDQIHQVERALPHLADPAVAGALREWGTVKPHLLAD